MSKRRIKKIAIIGSGIMGSGIACHFANIGVDVLLLDIVPRELNDKEKANLHHFTEPTPAREVSIIYHKSELKMQIIEALQDVISGIIRGAIAFQNVKIISPLPNK